MNKFIRQLIPFFVLGIAMIATILGILLLSYLFLISAAVGLIILLSLKIRRIFFSKSTVKPQKKPPGRIIDADDWKEL